ncbi:hypothetical protein A6F68_02710 [Tsuneonella dongtanensis]|uniref:PRC-barrel domain protein n=1 Tax=Tsuneonella dongtanensis TaxID=692370 RepID=A0A1B2AGD5_9SPHN|nr:hypothetical protein [Tsuneonella dongtanensis]ANY21200.1 hypothetical protein A6F68_02710 [Tsuneonella dongtanensis]
MKAIFFTSAALLLAAAPAQAQLLGGGLGGSLGGTLGGAGSLDILTRSIETVTRGAGSVGSSTEGSQSVDRRSGRVSANRKASAQGSGSIDQTVTSPLGGLTGSGSGSAQGSGAASGDAQLVGTDAVRNLAGNTAATARSQAMMARDTASGAVERSRSIGGSANGAATGTASGMFSGAAGQLALAGSAAGQAAGTFDIAPGMAVLDKSGDQIGSVRQVIADSRGRVEQLVVMTEDGPATIPAGNFTGSGSLLVSAMSEGKLEKTARRQAEEQPTADSAN